MAVVPMVDEDAASGVARKYSIGLVEPQVPALALGTGSSARSGIALVQLPVPVNTSVCSSSSTKQVQVPVRSFRFYFPLWFQTDLPLLGVRPQ